MQYILHDLLKLTLLERLDIIEQVINSLSNEEKQSVNVKYEKNGTHAEDISDNQ